MIADANLLFAGDVRGKVGGSTVTLDGNGAASVIEDLSGQGNDVTHRKGAGTHSEKALLLGSIPDQYVYATGLSDEKHWGIRDDEIDTSALTEWHIFTVFSLAGTPIIKPADSSSESSNHYRFPSSSGTGGRPSLGFSSTGGLGSGSWITQENSGGGSLVSPPSVNIESLTGRAETDAVNRDALVEWRHEGGGNRSEVWVNGYLVEFNSSSGTPDAMNNLLWGKRDLNLSGGGQRIKAIAIGRPGKSGRDFTTANAATVRAALLADFGIETWDGSTYPS
jgi:hypothetical protein